MVMLYRTSTFTVTASWRDGDLLIYSQDLGPGTPTGDQLHLIASDIAADETDPVEFLEQLALHGDRIVALGESEWLKSLGVTAEFYSWF